MKTIWAVIFLFGAYYASPKALAQQGDAARLKFLECKAKAEQGDAAAQFVLGNCYYSGQGVTKNLAQAVQWFQKSASQNDAEAQYQLASCRALGEGTEKDAVEAYAWFSLAALTQNALTRKNAEKFCGALEQKLILQEIAAGQRRSKELQAQIEAKVKSGENPLPGQQGQRGTGTAVQLAEIKANAEKGDAEAQNSLGLAYAKGEDIEKNDVEAASWWRKAAEQNFAPAQCSLGFCYSNGRGAEKNHAEAMKWWRKAAEQGDARAQNALGSSYATGQGVEKDPVEAMKWRMKSAEQNYALAQWFLGTLYAGGRGVETSHTEAMKLYRKSAEQNFQIAQYYVGFAYEMGEGVVKDFVEAYAWYNLAGRTDKTYADLRDGLEKAMSREQVAEAQKRTRDLRARIDANLKSGPK